MNANAEGGHHGLMIECSQNVVPDSVPQLNH